MIGVTPIAAASLIRYDVMTIVTNCANVTFGESIAMIGQPSLKWTPYQMMAEITIVSMSCETAVEPVERSHSMRLPVAFFRKKKTVMSTMLPIKNANIEAIWMSGACVNTTSN